MGDPADKLFERWCRRGDVQALAALFDLAAPQLLKLAIHLAGDAVEAEDLVQSTFLAAIEQRTSLDATRPALPWLCGVLAHKARDYRRRAGRAIDPERLHARAEGDASRELQQRELSGELAAAIDRVDEPFRQVLMLRFRHGLEAADIAHVLERSPATVRVQLHRGLEKLRPLVPASLASGLLFGLGEARGLAVIKATVLHEAAVSVGAVATTATLGGLLVAKKLLVACAVAAALMLIVVWRARAIAPSPAAIDETRASVKPVATSAPLAPSNVAIVETDTSASSRAPSEAPASSAIAIRGVVTDGETSAPIAGAHVRLFAPRSATLAQIAHDDSDLLVPSNIGTLMQRWYGDWPQVELPSPLARFQRDQVTVYDELATQNTPLAEATTASDGSFALPCGVGGGVLSCEHDSYGKRLRAARDPGVTCDVALWPEHEIAGRVIDADGKPMEQALRLVLETWRLPQNPGHAETIGVWAVDTDAHGEFTLRVAGPRIHAQTSTPGWALTNTGVNPANGQRWIFESEFDVPPNESLLLIARHTPALHFFDATTRAPVERVRLIGRELSSQYVSWSGEFLAPGGWLDVPGDRMFVDSHARDTLQFVAWSTGYREASVSITDVASARTIDVSLEHGDTPALEGWVRRGNEPVAGARVVLLAHSPLQWCANDDHMIDATETAADGSFRLAAPRGRQIVRVTEDDTPFLERIELDHGAWDMRPIRGREPYFESVELPAATPLIIDLAQRAAIEVEIVGSDGQPREAHVVALRGDDGRDLRADTDASGLARFDNLAAGKYTVFTTHVSTRGSFAADEVVPIELARGERRSVRIEIPAVPGPRHARVVARSVDNYAGWRARYDGADWNELAGDGTVPMDLQSAAFQLEIEAPDARRWSVAVPKKAPDGYAIRLEHGDARYRGVLLSASTGKPIANVRVEAEVRGPDADPPSVSCTTDEQGRFELAGLAPATYELYFNSKPELPRWYDYESRFQGMSFLPAAPASLDPSWLEIRVGSSGDVRVAGRVIRATNGEPVENAMLVFECLLASSSGVLQLGSDRSIVHTDGTGRFELVLPRTESRRVNVYVPGQDTPALQRTFDALGDAEEPPIELAVP